MTHLADGVGQVIVFFEEIKSTESQELKTDTHMAMIVEPVKHLHTQTKNRKKETGRQVKKWNFVSKLSI